MAVFRAHIVYPDSIHNTVKARVRIYYDREGLAIDLDDQGFPVEGLAGLKSFREKSWVKVSRAITEVSRFSTFSYV